MKLLKLEVSGYRSLKNIVWEPGDLNVFIGPNASGKTNLIKALELLAASADGRLQHFVKSEGGMEPMLWDRHGDSITFTIEMTPAPHPLDELVSGSEESPGSGPARGFSQGPGLHYELGLQLIANSGWYWIYPETLTSIRSEKQLIKRTWHLSESAVFDEIADSFVDVSSEATRDETLLSLGRLLFGVYNVRGAREWIAAWSCFRDFQTHGASPTLRPTWARFENELAPDGSNLVTFLHTWYSGDRSFQKRINSALHAAYGSEFEKLMFPPIADRRVRLEVWWKSLSNPIPAADLSDGTLRFLFLVCALAQPKPPPLIAIEEPEVGLHPSMLPIIAELAQDASTRSQVILTTHSTDFLDAFQRTAPTVTAFQWVDGETKLAVLSGKSLEYWVREYGLGELQRTRELEDLIKESEPSPSGAEV